MSRTVIRSVLCPKCNTLVRTKMWIGVNIDFDPKLKDKIVDESLFAWRCPKCSYKTDLLYPFLYHDMKRELMIYMIPKVKYDNVTDSKSIEIYPKLNLLTKRLVPDLNTLKEKMLIFDNGLDDMSMEVTKLAIARVVEGKLKAKVKNGYFCTLDKNTHHLGFIFFLNKNNEPHFQSARIKAYEKSASMVSDYCEFNKRKGFLRIDKEFAQKILDQTFIQ
jgi:hypothetical protein